MLLSRPAPLCLSHCAGARIPPEVPRRRSGPRRRVLRLPLDPPCVPAAPLPPLPPRPSGFCLRPLHVLPAELRSAPPPLNSAPTSASLCLPRLFSPYRSRRDARAFPVPRGVHGGCWRKHSVAGARVSPHPRQEAVDYCFLVGGKGGGAPRGWLLWPMATYTQTHAP